VIHLRKAVSRGNPKSRHAFLDQLAADYLGSLRQPSVQDDQPLWQSQRGEGIEAGTIRSASSQNATRRSHYESRKHAPESFAESLAVGNRTGDVAKRFNVSAGRVSQLRRELAESWRAFVGDEPAPEAA